MISASVDGTSTVDTGTTYYCQDNSDDNNSLSISHKFGNSGSSSNRVYMVVDNKIELETKYLRDYPEWQFLSHEDLNRKTIEIHFDLKIAKRVCNKDQKVIKVPNTNIFEIVAPILLSRGISRIVTSDKLIAL